MQPVVHVDVELWASAWILEPARKALLEASGLTLAWVANKERPDAVGGPPAVDEVHVILRDDSGPRRDLVLKDAALGVTVLAHSQADQSAARRVAEVLVALLEAEAPVDPASPVADVPDVNGPYTVPPGADEVRLYAVLQLTLVGAAL